MNGLAHFAEKIADFRTLHIAPAQFPPSIPLPSSRGSTRERAAQVSNSLYMMNSNPGDRMPSDPIASEKVSIDRKLFFLDLKENQRGRFLKITEDVGGRRDTIMLPAGAFRDFLEALQRLVEFESKL